MQPTPPRTWTDLKDQLHASLVRQIDWKQAAPLLDRQVVGRELRLVVERLADEANPLLNRMERERLIIEVLEDAIGFGPLEALFADDRIQEIQVDGPDRIQIRRNESFEPVDVAFRDLERLYLICGRILGTVTKPFEPVPNSIVEREETPPNFVLTARFPPSLQQPPSLHFRRLRPAVPPVVLPEPRTPPRLPPRELRIFVRFVQNCHAAGIDNLHAADEPLLRQLAEQVVGDFLAEDAPATSEEREQLVTLLLDEARQP